MDIIFYRFFHVPLVKLKDHAQYYQKCRHPQFLPKNVYILQVLHAASYSAATSTSLLQKTHSPPPFSFTLNSFCRKHFLCVNQLMTISLDPNVVESCAILCAVVILYSGRLLVVCYIVQTPYLASKCESGCKRVTDCDPHTQ